MKVRWASLITIRSGFMTRRIVQDRRSRRIAFIAIRLRTRRCTSSKTSGPGRGTSKVRARGRAAPTRRRSQGKTFSSHQRAMSGKPSRRSVSPVGAQSTITTSNPRALVVVLYLQQAEQLVHAREARSAPRRGSARCRGRRAARQPVLHRRPVRLHLQLRAHLLAPEQVAGGRRLVDRARPPASPRGCGRDRSRGRPCAARRRRNAAPSRRRRWSCRRRPCRCRGSSGAAARTEPT